MGSATRSLSLDMQDLRQRLRSPAVFEDEPRKSTRRTCNWSAMLKLGVMELSCVVEDFSADGCRVQLFSGKIGVGTRLSVLLPAIDRPFDGKVVWKRGDEAGISFR